MEGALPYHSRESLTRLLEQTGFEILRYSVSEHYNGSMEMLCRKK